MSVRSQEAEAMSKPRIIEPRIETPPPGSHSQMMSTRLPESIVLEQVQRLKIISGVAAGLWAYGMVMDGIVRPATVGAAIPPANIVIEIASILLAGLMFAYIRYWRGTPEQKLNGGLVFIVANAVAVALLTTWDHAVSQQSLGLLSWNTVTILVSAMIVPASPGKMLVASLIAATTDPLAVWVAHLRGLPTPGVVETLVLFMPNYACAAVATLPATVLQRLGRRLRQAQELGSYHLIELLGRGGMGEVWRARHRLLAREAAVKLVRPELLGARVEAEAHEMLVRFEREAQATAALTSPHTIRVFDFGITSD